MIESSEFSYMLTHGKRTVDAANDATGDVKLLKRSLNESASAARAREANTTPPLVADNADDGLDTPPRDSKPLLMTSALAAACAAAASAATRDVAVSSAGAAVSSGTSHSAARAEIAALPATATRRRARLFSLLPDSIEPLLARARSAQPIPIASYSYRRTNQLRAHLVSLSESQRPTLFTSVAHKRTAPAAAVESAKTTAATTSQRSNTQPPPPPPPPQSVTATPPLKTSASSSTEGSSAAIRTEPVDSITKSEDGDAGSDVDSSPTEQSVSNKNKATTVSKRASTRPRAASAGRRRSVAV